MQIILVLLGLANIALLFLLLRRRNVADLEPFRPHFEALLSESRRLDAAMRDEFGRQREEAARNGTNLREEVGTRIGAGLETLLDRQSAAQRATEEKLEAFRSTLESELRNFGESSDTRLSRLRQEFNDAAAQSRDELRKTGESMAARLEQIRLTLENKLNELQTKNEQKLEEMRRTVDEKLQGTLEKRLGESFKQVSERLEAVHKGLGEMQVMASSVGDLKRVLTNVKTRGTWGEIQLGNLLEQILTPEQYSANVAPNPASGERVEFAIKLPGRGETEGPVWLAIDAKFPQEDYQRLIDAAERADADGVLEAGKALETRLRAQAKDISRKYIVPPHTTDFALLFLPSEGLYAEALRRPGLAEGLQRESRVLIAGPTTLAAILNSLQMGFRTLAIQQRSGEVWKVLGAVKTEFGKFGDVLASVKKKLEQATNQIDETAVRSRAITRTLKSVEALPAAESVAILPASSLIDPEPDSADGNLPLLDPLHPRGAVDK